MSDEALLDRLRAAAAKAFPPAGVLAAYAYGSRVWGRAQASSDLDVGYYLEGHQAGRTLSPQDEMLLAARLEEALGVPVDLRDLSGAPLELRGRVLEDGARVYSGDAASRVALERTLLSRYHDYKDEFRRLHARRLRAVAARGL